MPPITSHEAAINWVIANQLGHCNLTPKKKSNLRGKRYNLEKAAGHGEQSDRQNAGQTTAEHLGAEYQVDPRTIDRDDAWMAYVYAGENATQRGSNGIAEARSVAGALRRLAKTSFTLVGN